MTTLPSKPPFLRIAQAPHKSDSTNNKKVKTPDEHNPPPLPPVVTNTMAEKNWWSAIWDGRTDEVHKQLAGAQTTTPSVNARHNTIGSDPTMANIISTLRWGATLALLGVVAFSSGCGPSLKSPDYQVRLKAVEKLTNQALLAKIAKEDNDFRVQHCALSNLTECKEPSIRYEAIGMLTNRSALAKIAFNDKDRDSRHFAIARLTDQDALVKCALNSENGDFRNGAVDRLKDQVLLAK